MKAKFQKSNILAFSMLVLPIIIVGASVVLLGMEGRLAYTAGIFLLSVFFTQTFILLHECGHLSFFEGKNTNVFFGHVFGLLTGIPFYTWRHMHRLHHKWTGWRDRDPTTEKTAKPVTGKLTGWIVNLCWWLCIPIFFATYMFSNYWNLFKIKRFLPPSVFKQSVVHVLLYLLCYAVLGYLFWNEIVRAVLPAFVLSFVWKELLIMTQHTHIEIPVSDGKPVKPVSYREQVAYSRSFYTFRFIARQVLFHFNLHEAHHAYPGLPAYHLDQVDLNLPQKPMYTEWLKQAKGMKGVDYIFKTSKHTGKKF